jgi:SpoVK/Ycf46/Vps4 family AAA+-type ATPase
MTGTFGNIMLILTTSNPSELDEAVLDRMDEHIHLPLPSKPERFAILNNAFSNVFCSADMTSSRGWKLFSRSLPSARYDQDFNVDKSLLDIAKDSNTRGFSGRELKKLIQMILYKCHASDSGILDSLLWKKETRILCNTFAAKHLLKA